MPGCLDAGVTNINPFIEEGKRRTALPTDRGVNRLKISGTRCAQKPVHHKPKSCFDADIESVRRFSEFRLDKYPAVEAPAGKNGFGKGFDDPKQALSLHLADHGVRKSGT